MEIQQQRQAQAPVRTQLHPGALALHGDQVQPGVLGGNKSSQTRRNVSGLQLRSFADITCAKERFLCDALS